MTTDRPITMADLFRVLRRVMFDDNGYWRGGLSMAKQVDRVEAEEKERCDSPTSESTPIPQATATTPSSASGPRPSEHGESRTEQPSPSSIPDDPAARALADAVAAMDTISESDLFAETIDLRDAASALLERYRVVVAERDAERAHSDAGCEAIATAHRNGYMCYPSIVNWQQAHFLRRDVDAARKNQKGTP